MPSRHSKCVPDIHMTLHKPPTSRPTDNKQMLSAAVAGIGLCTLLISMHAASVPDVVPSSSRISTADAAPLLPGLRATCMPFCVSSPLRLLCSAGAGVCLGTRLTSMHAASLSQM